VGTKSEASHAANNVMRKIKKHVSRKGLWRMCDQGPPGREGTPLMVSGAFAVALVDVCQNKVSINTNASP